MRGDDGLNNGDGYSCRALRSFLLQLAGPPAVIASGLRDFIQEPHSRSPGLDRCEPSVGCHTVRAGVFKCSPVEVDDTCEVENVI